MANVFISHSSTDTRWAEQIHQWLSEDAHKVFLDSDKNDGIRSGDDWQPRLFERLRWADAVICVVTPSYLASTWCAAEIGAAQALGSEILPVRASSEPLDDRLLKTKQYVDVIRDASGARDRLRLRLSDIDGTGGRGWPDDASPYPGLRPFQLGEHRVFFGRTREIKEITERLRSPTERAERAVLTVVGPSGCGKSSLIRAGVLPRIAGGDEWLALPPIVPGLDPIGNLVRSIASLVRERHIDFDVTSLRQELQRDGLKAIATDLFVAGRADGQCKLLIIIDQFEELLTQTKQKDRAEFVAMLEPMLGGPVQALATMRPEFLDAASKDADLKILQLRIQPLRPLVADALREVVEQPATVAGLSFEDGLVTRLVADTGSGDALPLLAFTLEQLADGVRRGGQLTHQRYDAIGGVQGALQRQADAALDDACAKTGASRDDVISALLGLVTIDEQGRPTKRRVALDECSPTTAAQLDCFVARRLLSTEKAEGEHTFVAVAHEAFLVNWPPLKDEIDADVTALRARRIVENAGNDWAAGGRDVGSLLQGRQLAKAVVDTGAELQRITNPSVQQRHWKTPGWWPGRRRLVTRVDLDETGREFLEASIRADRARRLRRITQVAAVIAVLVVITAAAVVGFIQARNERDKAQASSRQAIASRLLNEATDMLAQKRGGGDIQGLQRMLAAYELAPDLAAGGLLDAAIQRLTTAKIVDTRAQVNGVAFSSDGQKLATADDDGTVRLWSANTGKPADSAVPRHARRVNSVAFSPDGHRLASASNDDMVRLWNADTGQPVGAPLIGHTGPVNSVAFSPDGHRLASASNDGTVRLWSADTYQPVGAPLTGHTDPVEDVAFSPDGHRLVSGGDDHTVRLWNADTGQPLGEPLIGHHATAQGEYDFGPVLGVAFSPDGHRLASATLDGPVLLWNADTGQPVGAPLTGHTGKAHKVAFSHDGHRLASASSDGTVRLWNPDTGQPVGVALTGHTDPVLGVAFSPDGHRLASGSSDETVRVWNLDAGRPLTGHTGDVNGLALSPDGHRLATASDDKTVRLWNADSGQPIGAPLTGHTDAVLGVAFSPDGRRLASSGGGRDPTLRLWDADTGQPIGAPLTGHTDKVWGVAFSPDGHRLATGSNDETVRLWNADTGQPIGAPLTGHTNYVLNVAFSPDGHRLATASADKTVRLWNADTGQPIGAPLTGHTEWVYDVAFSPDGHRLASAGGDGTVRLWDADTGHPIGAPVTGHIAPVSAVVFSPDGHRLATAEGDKTVRWWNADTGLPIGAPLTGHTETVFRLALSSDGRRLASGSWDDTVRIWPVATTTMLCDKLTANMSPKQWREWVSDDPNIAPYPELCPGLPTAPG